jgi:pimeloyl-ACP methyl ester carboxylesterase
LADSISASPSAAGDDQTTYLASSYGTYLGQTYANLFPNRLRAMVLDGVIDPLAYANAESGTGDVFGPDTSPFLRILSPQASYEALEEFIALRRCRTILLRLRRRERRGHAREVRCPHGPAAHAARGRVERGGHADDYLLDRH